MATTVTHHRQGGGPGDGLWWCRMQGHDILNEWLGRQLIG